jgi:hypothetical protein
MYQDEVIELALAKAAASPAASRSTETADALQAGS